MSVLAVRDLTFRYPSGPEALNGVSFEVAAGTCCGLLGPNGAGKTTLVHLACGLLRPGSGTLRVLEGDPSSPAVRRRVGLCPQDPGIYPSLTGEENLRLFGSLAGLRGARRTARIESVLETTGLADAARRRVATYSGGMKRRLNLAVGLLHEPDLLILDEPTAGVDPQSRTLLYEAIERLRHDGKTLLLTTHHLEEAERLCGTLVVVDRGKVVAAGTRDDLLAGPDGRAPLETRFLEWTGRGLRD